MGIEKVKFQMFMKHVIQGEMMAMEAPLKQVARVKQGKVLVEVQQFQKI